MVIVVTSPSATSSNSSSVVPSPPQPQAIARQAVVPSPPLPIAFRAMSMAATVSPAGTVKRQPNALFAAAQDMPINAGLSLTALNAVFVQLVYVPASAARPYNAAPFWLAH